MNMCHQNREVHGPKNPRTACFPWTSFIKNYDKEYIGKAYSHMHLHIHDEEDIISVTPMCACLYHTYLSWQPWINYHSTQWMGPALVHNIS